MPSGVSAYRISDVTRGALFVYLYDVVVPLEHRRCRAAGRLIEALKAQCRLDGVARIWCGTSAANGATARTFEATGAQRVGETCAEYVYDLAIGREARGRL